jgi:CRISPR system Cascade subunit CasC
MLIELHLLQNHAPSNLNRDDTGSPKSAVFGGIPRARISSQCIKRSIRRSELFRKSLADRLATRTRRLPELVRERLLARGYSVELAELAAQKVSGFGNKEGKGQEPSDGGEYATAQTMLLSEADIEAVTTVLAEQIDAVKRDVKKVKGLEAKKLQQDERLKAARALTIDTALFGRMITSDAFRDADAAMQVAHAISTHRVEQDYDYFTAVDDLQDRSVDDDAGADMIGDVEFNSACYYKYFSLDVDQLVGNLTGERPYRRNVGDDDRRAARTFAAEAVGAFVRASALVTPTGKQNTFAAHQVPSLVLVEVRPTKTPISYANAFVKEIAPRDGRSLVEESIVRLGMHADRLTKAFNLESSPRLVLEPETESFQLSGVERVADLATLSQRLQALIHE